MIKTSTDSQNSLSRSYSSLNILQLMLFMASVQSQLIQQKTPRMYARRSLTN